ncbi:putative membrane protein ArfB [Mycobacterium marinum]|uniref:channel accessory protein ArfB n=1 Tax=Mycobacterium marinum TaxID=1781 RepID=UPI000E3E20FC|nr:putative membrane protein ArfB [Mycobacterium marinum]
MDFVIQWLYYLAAFVVGSAVAWGVVTVSIKPVATTAEAVEAEQTEQTEQTVQAEEPDPAASHQTEVAQ